MNDLSENSPAEPFFLKTESGECFCLYHVPHPDKPCYGVFIYIHPFADEMNKSRRMAALQARRFAAMGYGVLQIDLFGCGDSSGEFKDARWAIWKQNLAAARQWIEQHTVAPISLWGLRLGALLALDFAKDSEKAIDKIVLWQPVINGKLFLTQFLRLQLASKMLSGDTEKKISVQTMRESVSAGHLLEVAGYELAPDLVVAIDNLSLTELMITNGAVYWFEMTAEAGRPMAPASARIASAWKNTGNNLQIHHVVCLPFWAAQEITECPELISATLTHCAVVAV